MPDSTNIYPSEKKRMPAHLVAVITFICIFFTFLSVEMAIHWQEKKNIIKSFQDTSMQIRNSIIHQIYQESFSEINQPSDMNSDIYTELQEKLNSIRIATGARYLYTAKADENGNYIYVVDGLSPEAEDFAAPGTPIEHELDDYMKNSLAGDTVMSSDFMDTAWGKVCTAYFPIYDTEPGGSYDNDNPSGVYGILCMEFDMEQQAAQLNRLMLSYLVLALMASALLTAIVYFVFCRLRKAQDAVQHMNEDINLRLETILNGISGGFKISRDDPDFTYDYISEAAAQIQGYTSDELRAVTNGSAVENVYPADRKDTLETLNRQYAQGDTYCCKYRVVHKDGSIRWLLDSGKRIVNKDGKHLNYSLYQDVTETEEQRIQLQHTLTMLHQMVASLDSGIIAYTLPDHKPLLLNEEAKRIFGLPPQAETDAEKLRYCMEHTVMFQNRKNLAETLQRLKKPGDSVRYIFQIQRDADVPMSIVARTKLLQFEDGTRFILSSLLDDSKQIHQNTVMRQERKQYLDALTANCLYTYSFDVTEGIIHSEIFTSEGIAILHTLGLKPPVSFDEVMQTWLETRKPRLLADSMKEFLSSACILNTFHQGERTMEIEYYTAETDTYTRVTSLLSRNEQTGHVLDLVVATDTTQFRRAEAQKLRELTDAKEALEVAYEAANRANKAKSDFLSNMSHDIRTPMNAIIGMTAIAGTHLDNKERVADCLNKITVSSKHLLGLINEVLDMSKIESGKMDLSEEEFSLSDLVDNLLSMFKPQLEEKKHTLSVSIRNVSHEKVLGDSQRIQQIFTNLMSNAVKYTPDGGKIWLTITEKPTNKPRIGCYEFIFQDTGIGMSQEFLQHLFEPFARAEDSRISTIPGTGLGMAITKNIIQMMGGHIQVESAENEGSTFTVTVFLKLQDSGQDISYEDFAELPILVVDDDLLACETTCEILDELGMQSEWVLSGQEAVERAVARHTAEDDFFAVILDWKMPGMDGIAVTRELRRRIGPDIPIIIISGYDWSDIEQEANSAGVNAFISKPLFKSRLVHLFKELLGQTAEDKPAVTLDLFSAKDFSGKRALLVEDNELNAEIAGEILGMTGMVLDYACNGKEALDIMTDVPDDYYDIIFMDVQMPVLNGYEATRAIRSLPRDYAKRVPIIAMTANAFAEDVREARNSGMNEHITKPLDLQHLYQTLQKWL